MMLISLPQGQDWGEAREVFRTQEVFALRVMQVALVRWSQPY